ncbi:MAG TPA: dihydrofolate reductase family protein [Ktedonobacterales bacterium]|nr:dihydrofolate reductase family protein [Ktedonobacterales bacterium]
MSGLAPLETLYDAAAGNLILLPPALAALYGPFSLPVHANRPYVIGNVVTTLDGVVALNTLGHMGGGAISGNNAHDRLVMGLLRAVADAVVVGAGTLRAVPGHLWTAAYIAPAFASVYQEVRTRLSKPSLPLNVIVTARGGIDSHLPVFQSRQVPVLLVTTVTGTQHLHERGFPDWVQVRAIGEGATLGAQAILDAVRQVSSCETILVEGGPRLMSGFFAARCLDELFLTLAPQVAGRDDRTARPGLVAGQRFAPEHPVWGTPVGVKRGGSHLFLRYAFEWTAEKET